MSSAERAWWGLVDLAEWSDDRETRALASAGIDCIIRRDLAGRRVSVTLRWSAGDLDDALRRVHNAVGIAPVAFKDGYPLPL